MSVTVPGEVLRSAREARHLTQWEAARLAGVGQPYLSQIERGEKPFPRERAEALCAAVGLTVADLTAPQPPRYRRGAPAPAPWRAVRVASFTRIPASCRCDWAMTFIGCRPSGWALALAGPECPHHRAEVTA